MYLCKYICNQINIKVIVEVRQIEKEQRQRLQNDFEQFHREITKK
jgi:hypothetical protein